MIPDPLIHGTVNDVYQTRHGYMAVNARDVYVGRCLATYGEYSEGETKLLVQAAQPGGLVLDIGANIGSHTLPLARAVGDNGHVIAFEPQRHVFQMLCANLAMNSVKNVVALNSAVGAEEGVTNVPVLNFKDNNNFAGLQLGEWPQGEGVRVVAIDDLNLAACCLMKIDVEGWEMSVLRGAAKTIESFRPAIYAENNQPGLQGSLIRMLESMGYACYWHNPTLFNPDNFYGKLDDVFRGAISQNMFCLHQSSKSEMNGFCRALADPTGEIAYVVTPEGKKAIVQPTLGRSSVPLPDGKMIELGGPSGYAKLVERESPADEAATVAARIRERRKRT